MCLVMRSIAVTSTHQTPYHPLPSSGSPTSTPQPTPLLQFALLYLILLTPLLRFFTPLVLLTSSVLIELQMVMSIDIATVELLERFGDFQPA
jgi:hypothetical protein